MDIISLLADVSKSLVAAAVLGAIAWIYSWLRNKRLERQLAQLINANGVGVTYSQDQMQCNFSVQIDNYSNATIRVRSVLLVGEPGQISLELYRDTTTPINQTPLSNEIRNRNVSRQSLFKNTLEEDSNPNSVLLPPKTTTTFGSPVYSYVNLPLNIKDVWVVYEYSTIFGSVELVTQVATDSTRKLISDCFTDLLSAMRERLTIQQWNQRIRHAS
ncbi:MULTISPECIES: hypothetical protein [Luteimonas]|uniref:hypothetical protein n=1 Tax=Luteimonas TaxID=83614 RepID=UPI00117F025B|nr:MULTISPECIES: hypothetical protein [Luteimonas]